MKIVISFFFLTLLTVAPLQSAFAQQQHHADTEMSSQKKAEDTHSCCDNEHSDCPEQECQCLFACCSFYSFNLSNNFPLFSRATEKNDFPGSEHFFKNPILTIWSPPDIA